MKGTPMRILTLLLLLFFSSSVMAAVVDVPTASEKPEPFPEVRPAKMAPIPFPELRPEKTACPCTWGGQCVCATCSCTVAVQAPAVDTEIADLTAEIAALKAVLKAKQAASVQSPPAQPIYSAPTYQASYQPMQYSPAPMMMAPSFGGGVPMGVGGRCGG